MPSLFSLITPLAFFLPLGGASLMTGGPAVMEEDSQTAAQARANGRTIMPMTLSNEASGWPIVFDAVEPRTSNQVRIEQRVILRISPARRPSQQRMIIENPRSPNRVRFVERSFGKCVEVKRIASVVDRGNHLMFFLRDRRTLAARLEKGCSPRNFYQGFYMEPSEDGRLCIKRDRLMSRSGARCKVTSFKEIVAVNEN